MTTSPQWHDSGQGDLLALVAQGSPSLPTADEEWAEWKRWAAHVAVLNDGVVDPNQLRERIRGVVSPKRCGAFVSRAVARGLMVPNGWETSTDTQGRNAGRPMRSYRWLGGP